MVHACYGMSPPPLPKEIVYVLEFFPRKINNSWHFEKASGDEKSAMGTGQFPKATKKNFSQVSVSFHLFIANNINKKKKNRKKNYLRRDYLAINHFYFLLIFQKKIPLLFSSLLKTKKKKSRRRRN